MSVMKNKIRLREQIKTLVKERRLTLTRLFWLGYYKRKIVQLHTHFSLGFNIPSLYHIEPNLRMQV